MIIDKLKVSEDFSSCVIAEQMVLGKQDFYVFHSLFIFLLFYFSI